MAHITVVILCSRTKVERPLPMRPRALARPGVCTGRFTSPNSGEWRRQRCRAELRHELRDAVARVRRFTPAAARRCIVAMKVATWPVIETAEGAGTGLETTAEPGTEAETPTAARTARERRRCGRRREVGRRRRSALRRRPRRLPRHQTRRVASTRTASRRTRTTGSSAGRACRSAPHATSGRRSRTPRCGS